MWLHRCSAFQSWSGGSYGSRLGVATWPRISRSIHCTATLCSAQSCLHVSNISRSFHCTLHHDLFNRVMSCEQRITISSLHSNCTLHNHALMWTMYHDQFNAHCTLHLEADIITINSQSKAVNNVSRSIHRTAVTLRQCCGGLKYVFYCNPYSDMKVQNTNTQIHDYKIPKIQISKLQIQKVQCTVLQWYARTPVTASVESLCPDFHGQHLVLITMTMIMMMMMMAKMQLMTALMTV